MLLRPTIPTLQMRTLKLSDLPTTRRYGWGSHQGQPDSRAPIFTAAGFPRCVGQAWEGQGRGRH